SRSAVMSTLRKISKKPAKKGAVGPMPEPEPVGGGKKPKAPSKGSPSSPGRAPAPGTGTRPGYPPSQGGYPPSQGGTTYPAPGPGGYPPRGIPGDDFDPLYPSDRYGAGPIDPRIPDAVQDSCVTLMARPYPYPAAQALLQTRRAVSVYHQGRFVIYMDTQLALQQGLRPLVRG